MRSGAIVTWFIIVVLMGLLSARRDRLVERGLGQLWAGAAMTLAGISVEILSWHALMTGPLGLHIFSVLCFLGGLFWGARSRRAFTSSPVDEEGQRKVAVAMGSVLVAVVCCSTVFAILRSQSGVKLSPILHKTAAVIGICFLGKGFGILGGMLKRSSCCRFN